MPIPYLPFSGASHRVCPFSGFNLRRHSDTIVERTQGHLNLLKSSSTTKFRLHLLFPLYLLHVFFIPVTFIYPFFSNRGTGRSRAKWSACKPYCKHFYLC